MSTPVRTLARRTLRRAGSRGLDRSGKAAGIGLMLVLLAMSAFALVSSQATGKAASEAVAASQLSDDYEVAADTLTAQEHWEQEYRQAPTQQAEARFDRAAASFVTALENVRRDGQRADAALVEDVRAQHEVYVRAAERQFRAVDRGDQEAAERIERDVALPAFEGIESLVGTAADERHRQSLNQLDDLSRLEQRSGILTPTVFIVGLVVAGLLALVTREYRRVLVEERAQAVHDSLHDPLSGLPNRTLLHQRLDQMLRSDQRLGTSTGLLLIDLDRFKEINDTFGHQYGDALLRQVGGRITGVLREEDTVARLGGDEFAVLLPEVPSVGQALEVAHRLREGFAPSFRVFGVDLNVGASVGVVISGKDGLDATTLLQRADIAMYVAKTKGLGAFAYARDIDSHSPARLALLGELREALNHHGLILYYQPQIAVDSGELIGVEALVRWQHPTAGLLRPSEFIPLAEHTELIGPLTRYVLDLALGQASRWAQAGHPLPIAVNMSARNLLDTQLPELVTELLALHDVAPELLVLEVTESALMSDPIRATRILERLAMSGIRISIDDFGAGYTSLSQLKTLPINELKIDKAFVTSLSDDTVSALIVETVIELGHNLGLSIIAEGVESEETLETLRLMGCDVAQGYLFSRPLSGRQFRGWRASNQLTHPTRPQESPTA